MPISLDLSEAGGQYGGMSACPFCDPPPDQVIGVSGPCYAMWTGERPHGSVMVLPARHVASPFDLTAEEWASTQELLVMLRTMLDDQFHPGGYNVGWNVEPVGGQSIPHAHCHLIPRYDDEPFAGRGMRFWFKSEENRRT